MPTRRILLKRGALAVFSAMMFNLVILRPAAAMATVSKKLAAYQDSPQNG